MKRRLLAFVTILCLMVGVGTVLHTQKASALADGACPQVDQNDQCVVLLVNLTGKNIPASGITVTVKRQQAYGTDDNFALNGVSNWPTSGTVNGHSVDKQPVQDWTEKNKLSDTEYTSYFGIDGTQSTGGTCAGGTSKSGFFSITVSGAATGTSNYASICNPGIASDGAFVKTVSVPVVTAANPGTNGGISGAAGYYNSITQQGGNCSTSSILSISGGPKNINREETLVDGSGNYQSPLDIPAGSGYTVSLSCFDGSTPIPNHYTDSQTKVTITAGKSTAVDFKDTGLTSEGGGQVTPPTPGDTGPELSGCDALTNPLNWILCPVIGILDDMADTVDGWITQDLTVNTNPIFCSSSGADCTAGTDNAKTSNAYYKAWSSFRNLALGLMAIAGLIIVIAQALGVEILDAYTIRKMLPRLLIAAVGITLSWPLMLFLVNLSNDLGYGVRNLIAAPFKDIGDSINLGFGGGALGKPGAILENFFFGTAGIAVATLGALAVGFGVIMSLAGTAVLAVLVAIVVLTLRQVVIILLILVAPLAILAYILPNTQRAYKFWWESFSKALLMFPMIAGMIAVGRVFSAVTLNSETSILGKVIGFLAYFAPYFMIPFTFRFAGGIMSQAGNLVNSRASGGFNGLRNYRANQLKKRGAHYAEKFKTGDFSNPIPPTPFKNLNRIANKTVGAVNSVGLHANAGLIRGGLGFGKRGRTRAEAQLMEGATAAGKEEPMQANATINAFNRLMVLTAKHHGDQAKAEAELRDWYASDKNEYNREFKGQELEDKLADAKARMSNAGGYTAGRAVAAYLNMGRDGTAIRDVEDMGSIGAWVSEGSESTAYNLISQVGSDSKRGGRSELSPSQDHRAALVGAAMGKYQGRVVANYDTIIDRATMSGAGSETGLSVLSGAPSRVVRGNVEHASRILERYEDPSDSTVSFEDAAQAAAVLVDLQTNAEMGYGKTDNKIAFQTAMASEGRVSLLDRFLKQTSPTGKTVPAEGPRTSSGVYPSAPEEQSVQAHVNRLVGDKYKNMTPDQMALMSDAERRAVEERQQQQDQQQ